MEENRLVEPFERFLAYVSMYAKEEGIRGVEYLSHVHMPHLQKVARSMGVILNDDGTLELIKQ